MTKEGFDSWLKAVSHSLNETFIWCMYISVDVNCSDLFSLVRTDSGTINYLNFSNNCLSAEIKHANSIDYGVMQSLNSLLLCRLLLPVQLWRKPKYRCGWCEWGTCSIYECKDLWVLLRAYFCRKWIFSEQFFLLKSEDGKPFSVLLRSWYMTCWWNRLTWCNASALHYFYLKNIMLTVIKKGNRKVIALCSHILTTKEPT